MSTWRGEGNRERGKREQWQESKSKKAREGGGVKQQRFKGTPGCCLVTGEEPRLFSF